MLEYQRIEALAMAWAEGNAGALIDLIRMCRETGERLPEWALFPLERIVKAHLKGGKWLKRYRQDMRDLERFEAVERARSLDIKGDAAFEAASMMLNGTYAAAEADMIRKSYYLVLKRQETQPGRYVVLRCARIPSTTKATTSRDDWAAIRSLYGNSIRTYRIVAELRAMGGSAAGHKLADRIQERFGVTEITAHRLIERAVEEKLIVRTEPQKNSPQYHLRGITNTRSPLP